MRAPCTEAQQKCSMHASDKALEEVFLHCSSRYTLQEIQCPFQLWSEDPSSLPSAGLTRFFVLTQTSLVGQLPTINIASEGQRYLGLPKLAHSFASRVAF